MEKKLKEKMRLLNGQKYPCALAHGLCPYVALLHTFFFFSLLFWALPPPFLLLLFFFSFFPDFTSSSSSSSFFSWTLPLLSFLFFFSFSFDFVSFFSFDFLGKLRPVYVTLFFLVVCHFFGFNWASFLTRVYK